MVDGGSNICVTGDIGLLLDIVDIEPFAISVALEGAPSSYDDCITKQGLLPLTLTDGSTYYQTCFYCANIVDPLVSGDGQTVSYQPHIHANTIRS
jgi:hypothetical protein